MDRIEALVDAISHLRGSSTNPDSDLYQIRNPIGTMSFSRPGKNEIDSVGRRVFKTFLAGYRAAVFDLTIKCKGESRANLKPTDLLENLLRVLGITEKLGQDQIVKFLKRALKDPSLTTKIPLAYFVES
jgi:hypothetical protein